MKTRSAVASSFAGLSPPGTPPAAGSSWQSFGFRVGMPPPNVITGSEIFLKEATIPVSANGSAYSIPLSTHYGFRTGISLAVLL